MYWLILSQGQVSSPPKLTSCCNFYHLCVDERITTTTTKNLTVLLKFIEGLSRGKTSYRHFTSILLIRPHNIGRTRGC